MQINKKQRGYNLAMLFLLLANVLVSLLFPFNTTAVAATEIPVTGLDANSAVITDNHGNTIAHNKDLSKYSNFIVTYNWSIPDNVTISAGDTATFTLPANVKVDKAKSIPLYSLDDPTKLIGTATIKAGEQTGTITFTDALKDTNLERAGTLFLGATGLIDDGGNNKDWFISKTGWKNSDPTDPTGKPKTLTWVIGVNPKAESVKNVAITDTLGPNQTFDTDYIVTVRYGTYDEKNNFQDLIPGQPNYIPVSTSIDDQEMTINLGDITTAALVEIQTIPTVVMNTTNTWENKVTVGTDGSGIHSYQADAHVQWGDGGGGGGFIGAAILQKTFEGKTSAPLPTAIFKLQQKINGVFSDVRTGLSTDKNGQLNITQLETGNYQLIETQAPDGYLLDQTPIPFTIVEKQTAAVTVMMENKLANRQVILKKTDSADNKALADAIFKLEKIDGNQITLVKDGLKTDDQGQIIYDGLAPGNYQFVETQAPHDYLLDTTPVKFSITDQQTQPVTVAMENHHIVGAVKLAKIADGTKDPLAGAVFNLQKANGDSLETGLTTNKDGEIIVGNLEPGSYQFVETKAPVGYLLDKTPLPFKIDDQQTKVVTVTMENKLANRQVVLTKTDSANNKVLADAIFKLEKIDGDQVTLVKDGLKTDDQGQIIYDGLVPGNYQFVETQAPAGYVLDGTPQKFEISDQQSTSQTVTMTNTLKKGRVQLTKIDSQTSVKLAGAVFQLTDATGKVLQQGLTTNQAGVLQLDDLNLGDYQLVETQAPTGYTLDSTPQKFSLTEHDQLVKLTMENTLKNSPSNHHQSNTNNPSSRKNTTNRSTRYPRTNEMTSSSMSIIGGLMIITIGFAWYQLRHKDS